MKKQKNLQPIRIEKNMKFKEECKWFLPLKIFLALIRFSTTSKAKLLGGKVSYR
jgi:hypothetical protein